MSPIPSISLLKAPQPQVNICSEGIQSMQEKRGMGRGTAAQLCVEDSFMPIKIIAQMNEVSNKNLWMNIIFRHFYNKSLANSVQAVQLPLLFECL